MIDENVAEKGREYAKKEEVKRKILVEDDLYESAETALDRNDHGSYISRYQRIYQRSSAGA